MITYSSTRGGEKNVSASMAILKGIAGDGGLFVPDEIPEFDFRLSDLMGKTYQEIAYEIMKLYFSDFTKEELEDCINHAYDGKFDVSEIAPLKKADDAYYLELFHGATIAFKDMALSILPYLMTVSARKNQVSDKIMILTATSGDTGKAAMAGFADVPGTAIMVFYPKGGVSNVQRLQMTTQKGANVNAVAIHGNFDDAQTAVKEIFGDAAYNAMLKEKGVILSSANSINIGRLVPQIVYYVYAYVKLLEQGAVQDGEKINICVPTGNFGNILAAYLAGCMGLPVKTYLCASNDNKVLYDFFATGNYDRNREFILTKSPSMDILISSNLERLIFLSCGRDAGKTSELMTMLKTTGSYTVSPEMKEFMSDFTGGFATEAEVEKRIGDLFEKTSYVIDTHTAVGSAVYEKYRNSTGDDTVTVIASTASPFKFARTVYDSVMRKPSEGDDFEIIRKLSGISGIEIPEAVREIMDSPELHTDECDISETRDVISGWLG